MKKLWIALLFAGVMLNAAIDPMVRARTPVARWEDSVTRLGYQRFLDKKAQAEREGDKIKIVFLGDSITHFWERDISGRAVYEKEFVPYGVLNLSNSGDHTQHMLYITEKSGILEKLHPQLVVMMIGTNNLGARECGVEETVSAIQKGVAGVRFACPQAKILLFGIFPRGEGKNDPRFGAPIAAINERIAKLDDGKNIFYCDITDKLLQADGTLSREIMPDLLHPSKKGYEIWAAAIRPYIKKFVTRTPKLVAHRGESVYAPENTLPAYQLAWRYGRCRGVETDVHLTRDNVLVCCHDETTMRTTGVDWKIADKSFAELRTLDAGSWRDPMWYGTKLPSLQEVFMTIPENGHIFVEIKSAGPEFVKAFLKAKDAGGVTLDQVTIISFSADELKNVRRDLPQVRTLLLAEAVPQADGKYVFPSAEELIRQAKELGVNGLDLEAERIDADYVRKIHDAGLECHVWTVDKLEDAEKLLDWGVDSLTTNRSRELCDELQSREK